MPMQPLVSAYTLLLRKMHTITTKIVNGIIYAVPLQLCGMIACMSFRNGDASDLQYEILEMKLIG